MSDPFSDAYRKLFEAVNSSPSVLRQMKQTNILRTDNDLTPLYDERLDADLPTLVIYESEGGDQNIWNTSTNALFQQGYTLDLITGNEGSEVKLNPLKFAIMRALFTKGVKLGDRLLTSFIIGTWSPIAPQESVFFPFFETVYETGWMASMDLLLDIRIDHSSLQE